MSEESYNYSLNNSYAKLVRENKLKDLFDTLVFKSPYIKCFIGKALHHKENDGNTMLFLVKEPNSYILIGGVTQNTIKQKDITVLPHPLTPGILKFKTKNNEKIVKLMSPEGGFMQPHPYAIGEINTYLFIENAFISNDELKKDENPYYHLFFHNKYQKYIRDILSSKDINKIVDNYKKMHKIC